MAKAVKLSKKSYEDLKKELELIETVKEKEVAEELKVARSFGDLSENSEYEEAKNNQERLYIRKKEVQEMLRNAEIIDEGMGLPGVAMGSVVRLLDLEYQEEETWTIVGSQEADSRSMRISDESPMGKALLGKDEGDEIVVEAPGGTFKYRILEIHKEK